MSQTSYSFYMGTPFAGVIADYNEPVIDSFVSEEATLGLPFGIAVAQGTADNGCILLVDANSVIVGLTVHTFAVEPYYLPASPTTAGVPVKGTAGVMRRGRLYVLPEETVAAQDPVYARYSAGVGQQLGALRNDADTSTCKQISNAVFRSAGTTSTCAVVDINMP